MSIGYSKLDDGISQFSNPSQQECSQHPCPPSPRSSGLSLRGGEVGLWTIDQTTGKLTTNLGLDLGGNSIQNVSAILSASGNWRIDESGEFVVKKVTAEEVETKKLKVGAQEKPGGITIYDELTGQPGCVKLRGGIVQAESGECFSTSTP